MKRITNTLTALAGTITAASAATTLSTGDISNPTGTDRGNWHYQSASLNDGGFFSSGDALDATVALQSVSFVRYGGGGTTAGSLFLAVLTDATDLGSVVASSQAGIDVAAAAQGDIMTWNFNSESLSSSTQYFYAFYTDTSGNGSIGAGDTAAVARIWDSKETTITGELRNAPSGGISTSGEAAYISISVDAVPEPSTTALLGLGGLALILRRRK